MEKTEEAFKNAVNLVNENKIKGERTNDELLTLYKYFKQSTTGDVNCDCPGFWDQRGKAKWTAWDSVKGLTKEKAMEKYIETVLELYQKNN